MQSFNDLLTREDVRLGIKKDLVDGFVTLTDGASVNWDTDNRKLPEAKLTSTQSFTLNMTSVLSGSIGLLKILTNTASPIVITFDTDFTNKSFGNAGAADITTYTLPAGTGREYTIQFVVDGTTIYWYFNIVPPRLTFTTTFTGFSVDPTTVELSYVHEPDKKLLHFELTAVGGTSDNAAFTFVLPVAARAVVVRPCQIINTGTPTIGSFATRISSTTVDVYNGLNFQGFSTSGVKGARCAGTIQTI